MLDSANGQFIAGSKKANYGLRMRYDNMHNIVYKKQDIVQKGVQFAGVLNAGYELSYTYANNSQQIANIADVNYRVDRGVTGTYQLGKQSGDKLSNDAEDYGYDANGNLIYVLKGTRKSDSTLLATNSRKLLWDEENRLLGINDNGFVSNYWYDAAGERTVKESFDNEGVFVNGVQSAGRTGTTKFTAYVNPYLVISNGGNYTKHIYMGSQRITSKVSNSGIFSASPVNTTEQQAKLTQQTANIKERFDSLGVAYNGVQQTGGLVSSNPTTIVSTYFYHSDHLGSSSLITDGTGALVQHVEYVPFGETFIDERYGSWHTPYLFNGKEQDDETGLYYYGARYYDSRTSVWLSVDPLAEKKLWMTSYNYCSNNPINRIDPDGRHDYQMDYETGNLNLIKETEAKTHTIYASKENGKIDKGNFIEVSKDVLNTSTQQNIQIDGEPVTTNTYAFFNGEKAQSFFEFAINNSNVEWTNVSVSYTENSDISNYSLVTTSHKYGFDISINGIIEQMEYSNYVGAITQNEHYQINKVDHNHTSGSSIPSGSLVNNRITGDIGVARRINRINGNNDAVFRINAMGNYYPFSANQTPNSKDTPVNLKEFEIVAPRKR